MFIGSWETGSHFFKSDHNVKSPRLDCLHEKFSLTKIHLKKNNSKSWLKIKGCWKNVLRSDKTCSLIINNHNHKLFLNLICPNFFIGCNRSHYASCLGQYAPSSARTLMFFSLLAKTFEISCVLILKKGFKMVTEHCVVQFGLQSYL